MMAQKRSCENNERKGSVDQTLRRKPVHKSTACSKYNSDSPEHFEQLKEFKKEQQASHGQNWHVHQIASVLALEIRDCRNCLDVFTLIP